MAEHQHQHGAHGNRRRLAVAFGITAAVFVAQAVGALLTGSLALLVDTAHMLTDVAGLAIALLAASLALRPPSPRRTWGFRRAEVLAALAQAAVLLAVGVYALIEGVSRLAGPAEAPGPGLLVFGIVGLVGNVVALLVLAGGRSASLNLRAAFLEVLNDALGSVAVIVAAVVIATTGWQQADAVRRAGGALDLPARARRARASRGADARVTPSSGQASIVRPSDAIRTDPEGGNVRFRRPGVPTEA